MASRFAARNAVLVLVGDVSAAAAAEGVSAAFERLPAGAELFPQAASEGPSARDGKPVRVPAAVSAARAHVAWAVPGFGHAGWYHASLLMRGLAVGRSSPLASALVEQAGLAQEVRGHLVSMRDASTLVFSATAERGVDSQRLEQGLTEAVQGLLARGLNAAGLARAHRKALGDHYFVAQSFERRADLCASLACYLGAPERLELEPQRYLDVDGDALAGFAAGLLRDPLRVTLTLIPTTEAA